MVTINGNPGEPAPRRRARFCAGASLAAAIALNATAAKADYFDDVAASGRCWSNCDIPLAPDPGFYDPSFYLPTIDQLYQPMRDVLAGFAPYTALSAAYQNLPAPRDQAEIDQRVTDFYAAVYREYDHLVQALDYIRGRVADYDRWIADDQAYIQANGHLPAILQPQVDALRAEYEQKTIELDRWRVQVARVQEAERAYSESAAATRSDVVALIQAIAPPDRLTVTAEAVNAAESLATHYPPEPLPDFPIMPAGPAADSAADFDPWRPVERPLGIDLSLPTQQKVDMLHGLVPAMAQDVQVFDATLADLKAKRQYENSISFERSALQNSVEMLNSLAASLPGDIAAAESQTYEAKEGYLSSRDQMALRAAQNLLWTYARDEIVTPAVKEFLTANGIDQLAEKIGVAPLVEIAEEARNIKWSSMWWYDGVDEFMEVQEKVVGLLNPTFSGILQSAEFNGLPSTAAGSRFAQEVFQRLGDDSVEIANAAGQVSVDGTYQDLLSKLMGDMGPRQTPDEM